ncbi:MAG: N-acetyl-gamma-glutamyl-phosphate reductase, partial [bacterium]
MIKASIVGATGYVGTELLRLLNNHPEVEIRHLVSRSSSGKKMSAIYPQFLGSKYNDLTLENYHETDLNDSDVIFTALPHGVSQEVVADIYQKGVRLIDMSGDYRYKNTQIYNTWYGIDHKYPELAEKAVYGLVELNREEIKSADLIANPGCYVTASLLGLLPLIKNEIIDVNSIIIDAKSGVSGAGKSLKQSLLFNEVSDSLKAYNVTTHRHTSEIEYVLNQIYSKNKEKDCFNLIFTPHLIPIKRGILASIYADPLHRIDEKELFDIYQNYYYEDQFVQIQENELPELKCVVGSNYCHIGLKYDNR